MHFKTLFIHFTGRNVHSAVSKWAVDVIRCFKMEQSGFQTRDELKNLKSKQRIPDKGSPPAQRAEWRQGVFGLPGFKYHLM